jgi:DNA-binding LacI/PurR family transcriptional regulator
VNDDVEIASYLGLTTINQSLYESGREGARLLPLRLSLRHTTAPPRAE